MSGFKILTDKDVEIKPAFPQFDLFQDKRSACLCLVCTCCFCPEAGSKDEFGRDWVWAPGPCPKVCSSEGECCCVVSGSTNRICWIEHKQKVLNRHKGEGAQCDMEGECDKCCWSQAAELDWCCCDAASSCNCTKPKKIKFREQYCCIYVVCAIPCDDEVKGEIGICGKMIVDKSGGGGGNK